MAKINITLYTILIVFFFIPATILAQVTIGSTIEPLKGALLDLKEKNVTTKGLGLPRVNITKLYPTTDVELGNSIGSSDPFEMEEHIGLIVYNVADDPTCPTIPSGLYVWDGERWAGVGANSIADHSAESFNESTGLGSVIDYEGNIYPTKRFKSADGTIDAGVWMTKNLLSLRKSDGTFVDCVNGLLLNPALYNGGASVVVKAEIPEGNVGNYINADIPMSGQSYTSFAKEFGLSYTWEQAMVACPNGWHLPNQSEWHLLAKSMGGTLTGNVYDIIGDNMKANNNTFYKAADLGTSYEWGTDHSGVVANGFNALPAGYSAFESGEALSVSFSVITYWWSADKDMWVVAGVKPFFSSLYFYDPSFYTSVRCIRD